MIHFQKANPLIDFENSAVYPNNKLIDWSSNQNKALPGVSSFGISGTNCHLVVEEYKMEVSEKESTNKMSFYFQQKTLIVEKNTGEILEIYKRDFQ